jgi:hypothetical protein
MALALHAEKRMKRSLRKLKLEPTTVRVLSEDTLRQAVGGTDLQANAELVLGISEVIRTLVTSCVSIPTLFTCSR